MYFSTTPNKGEDVFKKMFIILLFINSTGALANQDALITCSDWSKDPKCWEEKEAFHNINKQKSLHTCENLTSYGVIESISKSNTKFECKIGDFFDVDCTTLAEMLSPTLLVGLSVKVILVRLDLCHIEGGCGSKSCHVVAKLAKLI